MRVAARVLAVGVMVLCGATQTALACQRQSAPVFQDDFKNADPGWGQPDSVAAFTPEGLVLMPPAGGSGWRSNANYTMAKADWCVEVVNPTSLPTPADEEQVGAVGVWFWGSDLQSFYTATITLDGNASVDRLNNGIWQIVVPQAPARSVKTAPGATNEVEVATDGNKATFYINGTLLATITGHPPANGGSPGVYGESGPKGTRWLFPRVALF
jgi:hypothetical protein